MAIFRNNDKKKKEPKKSTRSDNASTTIITKCMDIQGDIKGCGTIHVDGIVYGNLNIDESVIIGISGQIHGTVKSKKIMVSGMLKGSLICDVLEVTKTGSVSDKINANNIICDGELKATILAKETIHITENGQVETKRLQAKHIMVNGHINGDVTASELLEINKDGQVKGAMKVKNIKVSEGGLMLGTMLTYQTADGHSISTSKKKKDSAPDEDTKQVK